MFTNSGNVPKKPSYRKTPETVKNGFEDDAFEDFFNGERSFLPGAERKEQKQPSLPQRKEFSVFNYQEYYERDIVKKQIKELTENVKKELELIKKANKSLVNEVKDIENLTINDLPEKPGIYHVRFLEIIVNILRALRAKINESNTWMQALTSKKKKRGSLFAARAKKKGTQYSLSQELSSARSVQ